MDSLRLKRAKLVVSFLKGSAGSFPKQSEVKKLIHSHSDSRERALSQLCSREVRKP